MLLACGSDSSGTDTSAPDTTPDTSTPDTSEPDSNEPDTSEPDTSTPDTSEPDTVVADTAQDTEQDVPWTPVVYTYPPCGTSAPELAGCVESARLATSLGQIAGSRFPGDAAWQATQDLCRTTFEDLGFETTLQPTLMGMNVIGVKAGTDLSDQQVIIGAHYDGVRGCDAADDNGSGVAGLLEAARILAPDAHRRTLVVACWDVEELGLVGSHTHAYSVVPEDVVAVFNFEMIGYTDDTPDSQELPLGFGLLFPEAQALLDSFGGRGVFIALIAGANASGPVAALGEAASAIGLPVIPVVLEQSYIGLSSFGDLHRSDHASFWRRGIPAIQLTDTANFRNPNYHCPSGNSDTVASLDQDFMRAVVAATVSAAKVTLDADDPGATYVPHTPECDLDAQDCGAGKRCAFAGDDAGGAARRTCIDMALSPVAAGGVCTREDGIVGRDDCDAGLFCAFYGGVRTSEDPVSYERVCSPYCTSATACGDDAICIGVSGSFFEPTGVCRPTCVDPFSTECGDGQRCGPIHHLAGRVLDLTCLPAGPGAAGAACSFDEDCGVGHGCSAGSCKPYCDPEHPCAGGATCAPLALIDQSAGIGICVSP